MLFGVWIFLVYFLFVGFIGYFVLSMVMDEVWFGVCQFIEEILVDIVNLFVEIFCQDVKNGILVQSDLLEMFEDYGKWVLQVDIWGLCKEVVNYCIYVIDVSGKVLLDFVGVVVGQDYLCWNDVYLIFWGQYGVCFSCEDLDDLDFLVMYVVVLIKDGGKIIGVVLVVKLNSSL